MTIYIILLFFLLILGLGLHPTVSIRRRKEFIWIAFIAMLIVSGFRDVSVGTDTKTYVSLFNNIGYYNVVASRYEIGFLYYLKLLHIISQNPGFLIFVTSTICIGATCIFIYRHSEDPMLSVLLYVVLKGFFFQMTGMRQAIATSLVMLAFSAIIYNRSPKSIIKAIFLILIAATFHNMAVAAFIPLILWLYSSKEKSVEINAAKTLGTTVILSGIVFIFYPLIMRIVGMIAPQYTHYFSGIWSDSNYVASLFKMLIQLIFLTVGLIFIKNQNHTVEMKLSVMMVSISVIIGVLSMRMEIWGRLTGMFSIYTSVLWAPAFTEGIPDFHNRRILKTSIFLFSFAYMLVTFIFRPEWDGVVPYLFR